MNSQEYRSLLGQLPIKSPTPQDMARLCPHLTADEAVKAFATDSGYVACPSLRIRHSFHVLSYSREWVEEIKVDDKETKTLAGTTKNHPAQIHWAFAMRTPASYTDNNISHRDAYSISNHMDEAMKFAEDNWGDELILDDWVSAVQFYVQDPTDLVNDRYHRDYPRTKAVLYVTLNRDHNDMFNDHSKPESENYDEYISRMTLDKFEWDELKGGRGGSIRYNCAHCGANLSLSCCMGCGYQFREDPYRSGSSTILSSKMVAFLREKGHEFKVNPEIALTKERKNWERYFSKQ